MKAAIDPKFPISLVVKVQSVALGLKLIMRSTVNICIRIGEGNFWKDLGVITRLRLR